jgi:hypothetical protein
MRKTAKKGSRSEEQTAGPTLADVIRRDLREFVIDAGLLALQEMLERERTVVCGPRYARQEERRAHRGGHTVGELVMGGRRVRVRRPRARGANGHEVVLPSWTAYLGCGDEPLRANAEVAALRVATQSWRETDELRLAARAWMPARTGWWDPGIVATALPDGGVRTVSRLQIGRP